MSETRCIHGIERHIGCGVLSDSIKPAEEKGRVLTREERLDIIARLALSVQAGHQNHDDVLALIADGNALRADVERLARAHIRSDEGWVDAQERADKAEAEVERWKQEFEVARSDARDAGDIQREAQARVAELEKAIKDAPHDARCTKARYDGIALTEKERTCDCWKAAREK